MVDIPSKSLETLSTVDRRVRPGKPPRLEAFVSPRRIYFRGPQRRWSLSRGLELDPKVASHIFLSHMNIRVRSDCFSRLPGLKWLAQSIISFMSVHTDASGLSPLIVFFFFFFLFGNPLPT